ncbi:hypothetical protein L6164_015649 [Bauhinia variegata]|uniref:Uncharacterized protein n=1 Tax=Bauhinia variegata TaxID=167791 RepID=A0ACB9NNB3_BAUVA|nr:hypothetical protein L6164_015649 [Bauhinia variegata]
MDLPEQDQTHSCPKRTFDEINSKADCTNDCSIQKSPFSKKTKHFDLQGYQLEVFEAARRRNTIAVLDAGSGKTFVVVMLIKDIGQAIKASGVKKLIVFLAPTVHLVNQQFKEIKEYTKFEVEEYYGAKGVDDWNLERWEKEISEHDILVMTPRILLDVLRKAFLKIEKICLMIIDECHRATGNHPYAQIMKEFYHEANEKPKIFGITASPLVNKGVSYTMDCDCQISKLESILDSQVYPSAKVSYRYYDQAQLPAMSLKPNIEALWSKLDDSLLELQRSVQINCEDMNNKFKALHKCMTNELAEILYCLEDLGLLCAYEAVKISLENFSNIEEDCEVYRKISLEYKLLLEKVLQIIGERLPFADRSLLELEFNLLDAADLGYISPKLLELIKIFQSFGESSQVLCLIFVERIITARVVERFVKKVSCLSHFTVTYLTRSNTLVGAHSPKKQKDTMNPFCCGQVNLLFTTDVVEEGIHVPNCSYVIRFDLPKTVPSYVQSQGQARQDDSQFILMLERGNLKQRNQLFDIIRSKHLLTEAAISRDPGASISTACAVDKANTYCVDSTGASVTSDNSISLIYQYCDKIGRDKKDAKPIFEILPSGGSCKCKLTLPPNGAFLSRNNHLAKQLVCLEACKKLHQMGALNDHLLPSLQPSENDRISNKKQSNSGTTKRKELHGTASIRALCGTWADKPNGIMFYAYKFDFTCNIVSEIYSGFTLLIESKLDDDVGNIELELYSRSKIVKTCVSSCGQLYLDADQVIKAKCFHELFFNGLFGKLFVWSKAAEGKQREFLLQKDTRSLWNPSNLYFLLPLKKLNDICEESWKVNWTAMNSCASAIEFVRKKSLLGAGHCVDDRNISLPCNTSSSETECKATKTICFANCVVDVNNLKDMVVLAIHNGRVYCVIEVADDLFPGSPFDGINMKSATTEHTTFSDYYGKRYGIVLRYPEQPLLRLKQSHNAHNLLMNFSEEDGCNKALQPAIQKAQAHVHIPAELLYMLDVRRDVLKSLYLLPSLMHRLESLMLASQLRAEIDGQSSNFSVPSSMILEALTTLRCTENFSLERHELLGDSVLKCAVSCCLFLKNPDKHEGQLSARRSQAVCNSTLHQLGINRTLQGYIRESAFDPRRWVAPGQCCIHTVPCKCGVESPEVPLDEKFQTEDPSVVIGKVCDRGHRWICSKTIADCVEALIGAYYVGGGLVASLHVMKWLQIDAELDQSLVHKAITTASLHTYVPKGNEIASLEEKLGYEFSVKGLLHEAMTHFSGQEPGIGYCYERLEFLGDSVLDLLITWHLYQSYPDIDPGELTDLRSASVNNDNFAQAAVRRNLQQHLVHNSELLRSQIAEYVKVISELDSTTKSLPGTKGPKALGDLVESIAGAVLLDTKLNLDQVWKIFKPLLSPIVTPDNLQLPPLRELYELCDSHGYFAKETCTRTQLMVHAVITLQLEDELLVRNGQGPNKKMAKAEAAFHLLKELERRGISKKRRDNLDHIHIHSSEPIIHKKPKVDETNILSPKDASMEVRDPSIAATVTITINTKKGGPRATLHELCKRLQWPMPKYDATEYRQKTAFEFGQGSETRTGYLCFVSKVTLCIPNDGSIDCKGDARADKKSAFDSAAVALLYELQRLGKLNIADS